MKMNSNLDDPKGTGKYALVLDIIEHPERYTEEKLNEIFSDSELREIYNLLCKTDSAIEVDKAVDVDAEWEAFSRKHTVNPRRYLLWFGSRAASIAALVCTSIVAVAAVIAVTVAVIERKPQSTTVNDVDRLESPVVASADSLITAPADTIISAAGPIMFENEPLEAIMETVARAYGVEVKFNSRETASLHLYYRLDPALPLDEVVSQLNTFERIDIKQEDDTLIID